MAAASFLCGLFIFHLLAEGGAFSAPFSAGASSQANPGLTRFGRSQRSTLLRESPDDGAEDDEGEQDWRAFRAKLVASEKQADPTKADDESSSDEKGGAIDESDLDGLGALFKEGDVELFTPLDETQWAYDSGSGIETGAVILGEKQCAALTKPFRT